MVRLKFCIHPFPLYELGLTDAVTNLSELFPKKELKPKQMNEKTAEDRVSALTEQLKRFPAQPNNPFKDYARFDGKVGSSS